MLIIVVVDVVVILFCRYHLSIPEHDSVEMMLDKIDIPLDILKKRADPFHYFPVVRLLIEYFQFGISHGLAVESQQRLRNGSQWRLGDG